jgi:hypothetical protein
MTDLDPAARSRLWPTIPLAVAAYSALAVLVTFPLVLDLSSRVPKDLEDSLVYPTILWWNAHVVPLTERWWNGFAFFPATGMMGFSAPLFGESLIATPLQWLGASPVAAYNLTFLVSFPLCAVAAHALAFTLTKRHDAAFVCGLGYGFNPYRVAHVEHLELLMAFGMPLALAALHLYADTRRARWLVAFAAALTVQALSASYYVLFFTVLLGMWLLWFMRPQAWRQALGIGAAGGVAAILVSPMVFGYSRIHESHNLTRNFDEVLLYSADVSSLVTASALSAVWGWTASLNGGERQLFPGLTITALAIVGAMVAYRSRAYDRDRLGRMSRMFWAISACFAAIAIGAWVAGPWKVDWRFLQISVSVPYKPLSVSAAFAIGAFALSPSMRAAFRRRSAFAFYLIAAAVLFLCSFGPEPTLLGERILYEPPYAWLMHLPFFSDRVRVPARFGMLAVLALSIAASLAFNRITVSTRPRAALLLVVIGIVADGWIRGLALPSPPSQFRIPPEDRSAAVMELPLGEIRRDTAAMYRVIGHGKRTVNGYNGYEPLYYRVLKQALADRDHTALEALSSFGSLLIAADNRVATKRPWASFLSNYPGIRRLGDDKNWTLFQLPWSPPPKTSCEGNRLEITAIFDDQGQVDVATLTDENPATRWISAHPQRVGDALVLDLGRVERLCGLVVSMGSEAELYPRKLRVDTSVDNVTWKTRFRSKMGGSALRAAFEDPRDAEFLIALGGKAARFVTLRLEQSHPFYQWAVADIVVKPQP